jgi:hypothetical protein
MKGRVICSYGREVSSISFNSLRDILLVWTEEVLGSSLGRDTGYYH